MITYKNINYKVRNINLPEFGEVLISTSVLNEKLLNEKGSYDSAEAANIDEQIFYFVDENEIDLTDIELKKILVQQIK
jgi:hypothetical protein